MNKFKEKILVYKIKAKQDAGAFAELYDDYGAKIYRFIFFKVSSEQEAEDLSSEVFLKAWDYLAGSQPVKSVGALLYTIARNLVIDHYRQRKSDIQLMEETAGEVDIVGLAELEKQSDLARIYRALNKLKDEYREIVVMKYLDNMTAGEIASILQKSGNNVRVLLHRSLAALREIMEQQDNK
ncbi:MAG: RNA polymerase sigma factor [Patescibacteria group bacterium]|nr:RNA polymerase sigma factor [Patescibacteria group bacterium]